MLRGKNCFFLLPFILFLYLVVSESVEQSMYTDGVAYAGLSKNLANGIGTFWTPRLSAVHLTAFHSHPPLVFWIQSLFFRALGDGIVTERIYAAVIFLLSGVLMVLLWREALRAAPAISRLWFLPLTLWLLNEIVYHYYPANVLEPTMTLFILAAIYCCLFGLRESTSTAKQIGAAALGGILIVLATLCKGFVALFPLAIYVLYWLIFPALSLRRSLVLTLILIAVIGVTYALLWQYPPARVALWEYLEIQVFPSLSGERVWEPHYRSSHWYIIKRLFAVILPSFLVGALVLGLVVRKNRHTLADRRGRDFAYLFLSLGVAASFPLAISPKQSFYYLLPSMPFFALGFAAFIGPATAHLMNKTSPSWVTRALPVITVVLLLGGLINTYRHWGDINRRDEVVLHDIKALKEAIPAGSTVGSRGDIADLVSYFYRLHAVSIDTSQVSAQSYDLLILSHAEKHEPDLPLLIKGKRYSLYGR
ncbi:MAG: glycosyltransferase family 39 protein [Lewinella sp.]